MNQDRIDTTTCAAVFALADEAAQAIMHVYAQGFSVQHKADDSPVTAADLAAHRCIENGLRALTPDIPIISEESSADTLAWQTRKQWSRLWLIDPLDGTKDFIKRTGEFCINIALIDAGHCVFSVILQPTTGQMWWARQGDGAYTCASAGQWQDSCRIHCQVPAAQPLRVAGHRPCGNAREAALWAQLEQTRQLQAYPLASALKFCKLAEGLIDVYPRFRQTYEWDTAAGQLLVEQAGGRVVDLRGRPFMYNQRDDLENGNFIAAADTHLLEEILAIVSSPHRAHVHR